MRQLVIVSSRDACRSDGSQSIRWMCCCLVSSSNPRIETHGHPGPNSPASRTSRLSMMMTRQQKTRKPFHISDGHPSRRTKERGKSQLATSLRKPAILSATCTNGNMKGVAVLRHPWIEMLTAMTSPSPPCAAGSPEANPTSKQPRCQRTRKIIRWYM